MFFGRLAQPGGIIYWEIAEFMLRRTWYRPSIVVAKPEFTGGDRRRRRISYYFVWQNMLAQQPGQEAPHPQATACPDGVQPLQPLRRVRGQLPLAR